MEECVEVGCVRPAGKVWEGREVCEDHYDFYREDLARIRREMH